MEGNEPLCICSLICKTPCLHTGTCACTCKCKHHLCLCTFVDTRVPSPRCLCSVAQNPEAVLRFLSGEEMLIVGDSMALNTYTALAWAMPTSLLSVSTQPPHTMSLCLSVTLCHSVACSAEIHTHRPAPWFRVPCPLCCAGPSLGHRLVLAQVLSRMTHSDTECHFVSFDGLCPLPPVLRQAPPSDMGFCSAQGQGLRNAGLDELLRGQAGGRTASLLCYCVTV